MRSRTSAVNSSSSAPARRAQRRIVMYSGIDRVPRTTEHGCRRVAGAARDIARFLLPVLRAEDLDGGDAVIAVRTQGAEDGVDRDGALPGIETMGVREFGFRTVLAAV